MTYQEILRAIKRHQDFIKTINMGTDYPIDYPEGIRADLSNLNLEGIDLSGQDLSFIVAKNTNFNNAILTGCFWTEAQLKGSTFENAMLDGGTFINTNLEKVTFKNASMKKSILMWSDFDDTSFEGTDLTGTNFHPYQLFGHPTNFTNAILTNTDLEGEDTDEISRSHRYRQYSPKDYLKKLKQIQ